MSHYKYKIIDVLDNGAFYEAGGWTDCIATDRDGAIKEAQEAQFMKRTSVILFRDNEYFATLDNPEYRAHGWHFLSDRERDYRNSELREDDAYDYFGNYDKNYFSY